MKHAGIVQESGKLDLTGMQRGCGSSIDMLAFIHLYPPALNPLNFSIHKNISASMHGSRDSDGIPTGFVYGRLTDCLRICTGFWGGGFRIFYGFVPDLDEKAYGLFTGLYWIWVRRFTDLYRIWVRRFTDSSRICTGFGGDGFRIFYGFVPD